MGSVAARAFYFKCPSCSENCLFIDHISDPNWKFQNNFKQKIHVVNKNLNIDRIDDLTVDGPILNIYSNGRTTCPSGDKIAEQQYKALTDRHVCKKDKSDCKTSSLTDQLSKMNLK